ncbi:MAG: single-stranded DNA-binding protein [Treponema sp.]|nr:single-stranded DNA-binding protein [Treponema sp.]
MTDLNNVSLVGRLTRDAEIKYTNGGMAISNFSIAVNRSKKEGDQWVEEANFFDIALFGRIAESLKPYLIKGQQVAISGELRQDRWEKDGQRFSRVSIVANNIQLVGSKPVGSANSASSSGVDNRGNNAYQQGGNNYGSPYQQTGYGTQGGFQPKNNPPSGSYDSGMSFGSEGFPDDIPF